MPRSKARFTQSDIVRAIRGVTASGHILQRVEIEGSRITVWTVEPGSPKPENALDAWRRTKGEREPPLGRVEEISGAGGYPIPDGGNDPLKRFYDQIGFDPQTMGPEDMRRLREAAAVQWRESIPGTPLAKREKKALLRFASCPAGVLITEIHIGPETGERLEARGFLENKWKAPDRWAGVVLTEAGIAAIKSLLAEQDANRT